MRHTREGVISRENAEFARLDGLVANLADADWAHPLPRPETKDPWTVKDALVHITYWKASAARAARRQKRPPDERGLDYTAINHLIYLRWRDRSAQEVLAWHRQVHEDVLAALRDAPDEYFAKERSPDWPADLDSHAAYHRVKDIEQVVAGKPER